MDAVDALDAVDEGSAVRGKKLNDRLAAMAGFVTAGESVADIGADHGYLPMYLVREGISPFAILTDKNPGPLEKTRASVAKRQIEEGKLILRLGDGLAALSEAEVDTVVIAGMGAETIVSILEADPEKTRSFGKFIFQPRTKTDILRDWVAGAGWEVSETQAGERGRLCDIIVCKTGKQYG